MIQITDIEDMNNINPIIQQFDHPQRSKHLFLDKTSSASNTVLVTCNLLYDFGDSDSVLFYAVLNQVV